MIAAEIKETFGVTITPGTVRAFFKRATQGRIPLSAVSNLPVVGPNVGPVTPRISVWKASESFEEPDGDPFSTKVIPEDPWKPQRKKAS